MKSCNAHAAERALQGDERQDYMRKCLSGDVAADGSELTAQQLRMRTCNARAGEKSLAGEERRRFMSECLSG
jgi:hypothetical protein